MEQKKIKLSIGGSDYFIIAEEDPKYVQQLGKEVDLALDKVMKENNKLSTTQAAILLCLDYADEYRKAAITADSLREQIKDYLDDAAGAKNKADRSRRDAEKAKKELEDAKLEIARLRAQLSSVLDQFGGNK